ncbi:MAG: hypothetical protein ACOCRX_04295 [Candidatus Woesearchaeota archaeon]
MQEFEQFSYDERSFFEYKSNSHNKSSKNFSEEISIFGKENLDSFLDNYFSSQYEFYFNEINKIQKKLKNYPENISNFLNQLNQKEVELEEIIRNDLSFVPSNIINYLDIERNDEKEIILYHATLSSYLGNILNNGLMPPQKTGNSVWRMSHEKNKLKLSKVYLANEYRILDIADHIRSYHDGKEVSILETIVPESKLYLDEDSRKYSWIGSLNELGTCAYKGIIPPNKIKVVDKLESYNKNDRDIRFRFIHDY